MHPILKSIHPPVHTRMHACVCIHVNAGIHIQFGFQGCGSSRTPPISKASSISGQSIHIEIDCRDDNRTTVKYGNVFSESLRKEESVVPKSDSGGTPAIMKPSSLEVTDLMQENRPPKPIQDSPGLIQSVGNKGSQRTPLKEKGKSRGDLSPHSPAPAKTPKSLERTPSNSKSVTEVVRPTDNFSRLSFSCF